MDVGREGVDALDKFLALGAGFGEVAEAIDERALIMVPSWDQAILGSIRGLTDEQKRRVEEKLSPALQGPKAAGQWSCRTTTAGCGSTSEVVCYTSCRTSSPAEEQCSSLAEDVGYSSCRTSSVAEEQCSSRTRTAGRGSTKVVDYSSCRTSSTSEGQCCGRTRTAGCGSTAEAEPEQLAPVAPPTAAPVPVQPPKASAQAEPEQLAPPESSTAAPVPVQPPKAKALAEPEQLAPVAPPPKSSLPKPRPLGLPSATVLASSVIVLLSWLSKVLYSGKDEDWFDNKDLAGPRCQELILYEPWERMVQGSDSKWVFGADCLADDLESFCQCVSENVDKEEDDQPASPPNKKQRPDEDLSLSPAGCSASALTRGSQLEPVTEPSKGPVVRSPSVTWSADAVRRQVPHAHADGLAATPPAPRKPPASKRPVDAEALPQLPPEKMAKYDSWWKTWGKSASRDSDATIASSATESDGSDVMQTVQLRDP
eukprot:s3037_g6.t1